MDHQLLLSAVARHIQLTEKETGYFLSVVKRAVFQKKEHLLRAGEIPRVTNFITKGCLRSYTTDQQGVEHTSLFGIEGWWISDLSAFLKQSPATYGVIAIEPTEVLQIEKNDLEAIYATIPKFERYFRILHQNAFITLNERYIQNISIPAEERYLAFRKKYPGLELRVPLKYIASYLGITPEFLSMLRRRLAKSSHTIMPS